MGKNKFYIFLISFLVLMSCFIYSSCVIWDVGSDANDISENKEKDIFYIPDEISMPDGKIQDEISGGDEGTMEDKGKADKDIPGDDEGKAGDEGIVKDIKKEDVKDAVDAGCKTASSKMFLIITVNKKPVSNFVFCMDGEILDYGIEPHETNSCTNLILEEPSCEFSVSFGAGNNFLTAFIADEGSAVLISNDLKLPDGADGSGAFTVYKCTLSEVLAVSNSDLKNALVVVAGALKNGDNPAMALKSIPGIVSVQTIGVPFQGIAKDNIDNPDFKDPAPDQSILDKDTLYVTVTPITVPNVECD